MKWRTTTRPNGQPGHREQVAGWDVILPRIATIVSILVGLGGGLAAYVNVVSTQAVILAKIEAAEKTLPATIAKTVAESGLVSRGEWLTDKEAQDKQIFEGVQDLKQRMGKIEEHSYHTLRVVESYDNFKKAKP